MKKVIVNNKEYWSNIEGERLQKCIMFFSDGCSSYAISFDNKESDIIDRVSIEGMEANILRGFNFKKCFVPNIVKDYKDSDMVLRKGLDLIELL